MSGTLPGSTSLSTLLRDARDAFADERCHRAIAVGREVNAIVPEPGRASNTRVIRGPCRVTEPCSRRAGSLARGVHVRLVQRDQDGQLLQVPYLQMPVRCPERGCSAP